MEQWIRGAATTVEVLPTNRAAGEVALYGVQVTTRSPMGAIAYETAGMFIDSGWLRILGAGRHPRFQRSLPTWNEERSDGFYLVADDVIGRFFALNGGAFGDDRGNVYYYAPDTLNWEPCGMGYSQFLVWAMSGKLGEFCGPLRWEGWRAEVVQLSGDQALSVYPFLFAQGPPIGERSRRPVPIAEIHDLLSKRAAQWAFVVAW